jgi:hypothetical protein
MKGDIMFRQRRIEALERRVKILSRTLLVLVSHDDQIAAAEIEHELRDAERLTPQ